MIIQHNIEAMSAYRSLGTVASRKTKSSERLSSGYQINRAADDAANLTISEKIRFLIRGLKQGSDNIGEGIDLVRTADGALEEVHSMLQRMNELTVKGLNGTNCTEDRDAVQKEIDQLYAEICRVAESTEYNTKKILCGNPVVTRTIRAEDTPVTREVPYVKVNALKMPDWIDLNGSTDGSDSEMTLGGVALNQTGNEGTSHKSVRVEDPNEPDGFAYYKNNKGDYVLDSSGSRIPIQTTKSNSQWSASMDNNYSAYLDFSGLASTTGTTTITNTDGSKAEVNNLYQNLADMVGTGFYTTCCTCNKQYNIIFDSSKVDFEYCVRDESRFGANIHVNIDSFLERARDMDPGDSTAAETLTKDFVDYIAEQVNKNVSIQSHYTRLMTTTGQAADPYRLIVYDFRDYTADSNDPLYGYTNIPDKSRGIGTVGALDGDVIYYRTEVTVMPGTEYSYEEEEPLTIQHGDAGDNYSMLHLPDLPAIFDDYGRFGYDSIKDSLSLVYKSREDNAFDGSDLADGKLKGEEFIAITKTIFIPAHTREGVEPQYVEQPIWENGEYRGIKQIKIGEKVTKIDVPDKYETYTEYLRVEREDDKKSGGYKMPGPQIRDNLNYKMLDVIDNLINKVSYMRTDLGARQNALEHAYNYNEIARENETAAESKIRDTDMAKEIMNQSKNSILEQAGQAMLAQANSANELVLRLLQA